MKHCDLPAILEQAAHVASMVDVQDSPAVTIAADDAYAIGDMMNDRVPAMVAEISVLRAGILLAIRAMESVGPERFMFTLPNMRALLLPKETPTDG